MLVGNGHTYLKKFEPMLIGCLLRTAGSCGLVFRCFGENGQYTEFEKGERKKGKKAGHPSPSLNLITEYAPEYPEFNQTKKYEIMLLRPSLNQFSELFRH